MPALLIWTKPLSLCTAGLVSPRTNFLSRHSCLTNSFPSLYFRSTSVSPLIPPSLCGACVISESLANQLHCALVWKSFAFRDGKQAAAMLCTAVASGWAWEAWRGLQTQCAALAPAKNLLQADGNAHSASGLIALQRTQSPRSPAPTTPYSSPSVDHEQGEASSQLTAALPGPGDGHSPPQPQTSLREWAAPTQGRVWSSLPLVSHVMCSSLQAHVIRLHFPLFLFSLRKPSCTMSIFSTSWSWIRCLTCGLPSPKGKISTFFLQWLNYRHKI